MGRTFSLATKEEWKSRAMGGRADGVATFKMPTMQHGTLCNQDVLPKGCQPKMVLYALNKLFYIFDQVKWQRGMDERLIMAYKILCLSTLQCTEWQHGSEKKGMPDAPSLLNINDACQVSCGWFMMGHCWWGGDLSYLGTASGVPCWWASTGIFTRAMMMWPTALCIH